jgi:hypothetical protein
MVKVRGRCTRYERDCQPRTCRGWSLRDIDVHPRDRLGEVCFLPVPEPVFALSETFSDRVNDRRPKFVTRRLSMGPLQQLLDLVHGLTQKVVSMERQATAVWLGDKCPTWWLGSVRSLDFASGAYCGGATTIFPPTTVSRSCSQPTGIKRSTSCTRT